MHLGIHSYTRGQDSTPRAGAHLLAAYVARPVALSHTLCGRCMPEPAPDHLESGAPGRTSSATTVQFMVHSRGMKEPVASQKGAMLPSGSTMALLDTPNSVPDVPREMTHVPSCTVQHCLLESLSLRSGAAGLAQSSALQASCWALAAQQASDDMPGGSAHGRPHLHGSCPQCAHLIVARPWSHSDVWAQAQLLCHLCAQAAHWLHACHISQSASRCCPLYWRCCCCSLFVAWLSICAEQFGSLTTQLPASGQTAASPVWKLMHMQLMCPPRWAL